MTMERISTLFDAYLFVDWSGSSRPRRGRDSIWIGETMGGRARKDENPRTRQEATILVRERLRQHFAAGRRVLVGFDFPYGYPRGLAAGLGLAGDPWSAIWSMLAERIEDDEKNRNNRFDVASDLNREATGTSGPFWTCPVKRATKTLTTKKTKDFPMQIGGQTVERLRRTEALMSGVHETWKLLGAGSVGSQAMLGIPRVHALRHDPDLVERSAVWPFETGFRADPVPEAGPFVLHAEIWPGIVDGVTLKKEVDTGAIRDQAQVRLMCRWAREHDKAGTLAAWFDRPPGSTDDDVRAAEMEEGWILGCPGSKPPTSQPWQPGHQ